MARVYPSNKKYKRYSKTVKVVRDLEMITRELRNRPFAGKDKSFVESLDLFNSFKTTKTGIYTKPTIKKIKRIKREIGISTTGKYVEYIRPTGIRLNKSAVSKYGLMNATAKVRRVRLSKIRDITLRALTAREPTAKVLLNFSRQEVIDSFKSGTTGLKRPRIKRLMGQASFLNYLRELYNKYFMKPEVLHEITPKIRASTRFSDIWQIAETYGW